MPTTSDLKRGTRIELEGDPFVVEDYASQSPSARSASTLVKAKIRNLRTGQLVDRTFKSGERVREPDFEVRAVQYLYEEGGETHYFMDTETYEQFGLDVDQIRRELDFLRENDACRALMFNGACIGIELPHTVTLEVFETEPTSKGDTVTHVQKGATLETGVVVQVPLFINTGDLVVVDTRERRYVRRG